MKASKPDIQFSQDFLAFIRIPLSLIQIFRYSGIPYIFLPNFTSPLICYLDTQQFPKDAPRTTLEKQPITMTLLSLIQKCNRFPKSSFEKQLIILNLLSLIQKRNKFPNPSLHDSIVTSVSSFPSLPIITFYSMFSKKLLNGIASRDSKSSSNIKIREFRFS